MWRQPVPSSSTREASAIWAGSKSTPDHAAVLPSAISRSGLRQSSQGFGLGSPVPRGFRSSFLLAFTHRSDEQLAKINAAVEGSVVTGEHDLLPVLASRDDAVQDTVTELFGSLQSGVVRCGSDSAGWARGTMAADLAHLNAGNLAGHDGHDGGDGGDGRERREQWRELA